MEDNNPKAATRHELTEALEGAVQTIATRIRADMTAAEERAQQTARNTQTEILRGIEALARGNFARMHRLETSDAGANERITALEERVLYLETRRQ
jgi:phage shock protein A